MNERDPYFTLRPPAPELLSDGCSIITVGWLERKPHGVALQGAGADAPAARAPHLDR